jgi:hypothetical protein
MRVLKRSLVGLIGLFAASAAVAQEMNWVKVDLRIGRPRPPRHGL